MKKKKKEEQEEEEKKKKSQSVDFNLSRTGSPQDKKKAEEKMRRR